MGVTYRVTVEPTTEPVTLADMQDYIRVDAGDDDTQITSLISNARKYCEEVTGRAFATQTIVCQYIIDKPAGGLLSGPINDTQESLYHYEQQLGANPFGVSQFYFDLPLAAPLQSITSVGTQLTKFAINGDGTPNYTPLLALAGDGITVNWSIDTLREPGRIYFQAPLIVYSWQFVYVAGHNSSYVLPYSLKQALKEVIAYWYDHREGDALPEGIMSKLLAKRIDWM